MEHGHGGRGGAHPMGHPGGHPGSDDPAERPGGHEVFHRQYAAGAPWDIGRPQAAYVELEEAGRLGASVLEVGCGTGELTLYLATRGHEAVGIDVVPVAIDAARRKAKEREARTQFFVADALDAATDGFPEIGAPFDEVVDVGFFHALTDEQRVRLLDALAVLLAPAGTYHFLCFSDKVPGTWGPRRVSESEIRQTFSARGWEVVDVAESRLETARPEMPRLPAWLAEVRRTEP